jgi:titin
LADDEKPDPPRFTVELKDVTNVPEGAPAHFDCRVEPVGDSSMRIDWFLNGRPFPFGSRVHTINDFGYVVMDLDWTYPRDSGELICRATNKWGSATTKASLTCKGLCNVKLIMTFVDRLIIAKRGIIMETQLPEGLVGEKLAELEKGNYTSPIKEDIPLSPPKFITQV